VDIQYVDADRTFLGRCAGAWFMDSRRDPPTTSTLGRGNRVLLRNTTVTPSGYRPNSLSSTRFSTGCKGLYWSLYYSPLVRRRTVERIVRSVR